MEDSYRSDVREGHVAPLDPKIWRRPYKVSLNLSSLSILKLRHPQYSRTVQLGAV
jgi:hypothetical protein